MAIFLTHTSKKKMTAGERYFTDVLQRYLDDDYHIWYNLPLQGEKRRYPDFLIFHAKYGLLSIELKDWSMKSLKGFKGNQIYLDFDNNRQNHLSPIEQARDTILPLIHKMQKDPLLQQETGEYRGKLVIPWGYGAVMTNWVYGKLNETAKIAIEAVFPRKSTFYREDILEGGLDREAFIQKLHSLFPYPFDYPITFEQASRIRAHIFPEFIINGDMQFFNDIQDPVDVIIPDKVQIMDNKQEQVARKMGFGHRVFHGVAGSGKTLLLIHRARILAKKKPDKPILVLCFNKSLASFLSHQINLPNVLVYHYHGWCKFMKEKYGLRVIYNKEIYPNRLAATVYQAILDGEIPKGQYSAVLVDEGHDFDADWLRVAVSQSEGEDQYSQNFLLLYDDAQSIYHNKRSTNGLDFSLSSVGIAAVGRTEKFYKNYRNSYEIFRYASNMLSQYIDAHETDDDGIPVLMPTVDGIKTNIQPKCLVVSREQEVYENILQTLKQWQYEGIELGNIAILCQNKKHGGYIVDMLIRNNIRVDNLIDDNNRLNYQKDMSCVLVCTVHSSKGLEFERVILAQLEFLKSDTEEEKKDSARLLYVGMTRAKTHLVLISHGENCFTRSLKLIEEDLMGL